MATHPNGLPLDRVNAISATTTGAFDILMATIHRHCSPLLTSTLVISLVITATSSIAPAACEFFPLPSKRDSNFDFFVLVLSVSVTSIGINVDNHRNPTIVSDDSGHSTPVYSQSNLQLVDERVKDITTPIATPRSQQRWPVIPKDDFGHALMMAIIEYKSLSLRPKQPIPPLDPVDELSFGATSLDYQAVVIYAPYPATLYTLLPLMQHMDASPLFYILSLSYSTTT
jgi:hypothetical protein